jgi:hypothetical protein
MAKTIMLASIAARTEKGFGAVASDIADIKCDMATKEQVIGLHRQVNSIETQLRDMKRNHSSRCKGCDMRLADLFSFPALSRYGHGGLCSDCGHARRSKAIANPRRRR